MHLLLLLACHRDVTPQPTLAEVPAPSVSPEVPESRPRHRDRPSNRREAHHVAVDPTSRDVAYGTDPAMTLDLYRPAASGPRPVAVYVHGGGWKDGDKSRLGTAFAIPELIQRGYLVVTVNYRLAPAARFPAQIEDVKCAIRFLRAHATEYALNPERIGAWGGSAGGHLVALLGTSDASAGLEGSCGWADQSSRVQAVVDMFGPVDLTPTFPDTYQRNGADVFGATSLQDPVLVRASPITYVSKDDPPFLLIHGTEDNLVPIQQSEAFAEKLKAAGVPVSLLPVQHAGHSLMPASGDPTPGRAEVATAIADFFDKYLLRDGER